MIRSNFSYSLNEAVEKVVFEKAPYGSLRAKTLIESHRSDFSVRLARSVSSSCLPSHLTPLSYVNPGA